MVCFFLRNFLWHFITSVLINSFIFFFILEFLFSFIPEVYFHRILGWQFFSFSTFKTPFCFGFYDFWWQLSHSNHCCSRGNVLFFSGCFQALFFVLLFSSLIMMCLDIDLFKIIMLGIYWASRICTFVSFAKKGRGMVIGK